MNTTSVTAHTAKRDLYRLLKEVNSRHEEIEIIGENIENSGVLIGLSDWRGIQETLMLEQTGTLAEVRHRENDNSGFTNIEDIDWEK